MCQKYRVGWNNPTVCFAGYYKHLDVAFTTDCSTTLNSELWFVAARKCFMELPPKPTLHSGHKFRSLEFEGTNFSSVKLKFYCHACRSTVALGVAGGKVSYANSLKAYRRSSVVSVEHWAFDLRKQAAKESFQLCTTSSYLLRLPVAQIISLIQKVKQSL